MTHLRIEQNNGQIERVSISVIAKLYDLALNNTLDSESDIIGRLEATSAYKRHVDYLTTRFNNLYITAASLYLSFTDPVFESLLLQNNIGDGTGISQSDASAVTELGDMLYGSNITSLNDLEYFPNLTDFGGNSTGTTTGYTRLANCSNLSSAKFTYVKKVRKNFCLNCSNLTYMYFPRIEEVGGVAFVPGVTTIKFGPNLTFIGSYAFWNASNLTTLIFEGTTPPTYQLVSGTGDTFKYNNNGLTVYVPDAAVNDYKNATGWAANASIVHPISEYQGS